MFDKEVTEMIYQYYKHFILIDKSINCRAVSAALASTINKSITLFYLTDVLLQIVITVLFSSSQPELVDIAEVLAREVARKINAIFSQLSSTLLSDNQTLKTRVGQLESELTTVTKNYENARLWRENVLSGCPVLFEQSGLIYTLKPFGVLKKKTDQVTEGVTESSPAAGTQSGHDAGNLY